MLRVAVGLCRSRVYALATMAKSMPTANNARRPGRPAQGINTGRLGRTNLANQASPSFPAKLAKPQQPPRSAGKRVYKDTV